MPVASADIKDFVSSCWFAHGSTALLRREAFDRVGPTDPGLRRLEDYDWFIRFALLGGRLEIWPHFAALIEVRSKAGMQSAEPSIAHLRAKYANPAARLPPDVINQIEACLDFELASIRSADGRWLATLFYLCRSFWRVPRTTLHLRRLWTRTAVDLPGPGGRPRRVFC